MSEVTQNSKHTKKSILKKWWFWLIVVVAIIAIGASTSKSDEATKIGENGSSSQEQQTAFNVGDVIAYDGKEITIKSVERNFDSGNQFIKPADGKEYIKVSIYIENKSDDKLAYNTYDWELQDGSGDIKSVSSSTYSIDDNLGSGDLAKGGKKSGILVFEVPKDDNELTLHYKSSFWSSKTIEIKL